MKILMVGHSYVVALNRRLCRELARAGGDAIRVTVAAPSFVHGDLRPIPLEPLDGEPYTLVPVPCRFSRVPQLMTYGRTLGRLIRGGDWDVVHAWEEPYILAGRQIARATPRGASLVFSTFQNIPKTYPPPFRQIERMCLERAAGWTAFGKTIAEVLGDRPGYRDRPFRTIPLGVDVDTFKPDPAAGRAVRRALGWAETGSPVVGFLGRFVPEKGLELLTETLDAQPRGSWRALIVGSGPMEPDLRAWAARHGDAARVVTGVTHDGVPPYLNAMDLMAAPSQTTPRWREQLGRMLLEAMACGVPVVASDSGEIPHVVADAGRIVPEADQGAWRGALGELLASAPVRAELGVRGRERACDVYAWPRVARSFLAFFTELRSNTGGLSTSGR